MENGREKSTPANSLTEERRTEFAKLFREFAGTYPSTPAGKRHIEAYEEARSRGRENLREVLSANARGEDVTELVLLKLLPHSDTASNRKKGAWTHIAPAVQGDIRRWFEGVGWAKPEDWPQIARALLGFILRCVEDPTRLAEACGEFSASPHSKGFQTGLISPILNALRPDYFLLVNNKSRMAINYFAGTSFGQRLADYPAINKTGWCLIEEVRDIMRHPALEGLREADRFDMFSHWLKAIKKHPLKDSESFPGPVHLFSEEAFGLLEGLHENPTRAFYQEHREEFREYLEEPLQRLFRRVAAQLDPRIKDLMETENNLFGRIPKNDYGRGGAWDFYWGAFYPKGRKRISDAQLFVRVDRARLEFGFHIGEQGSDSRQRFARNLEQHRELLAHLLQETASEEETSHRENRGATLEQWLDSSQRSGIRNSTVITKEEVLASSEEELAERISRTFKRLFPLVLLACRDDPVPEIHDYLGLTGKAGMANPAYPLAQLSEESGFEEEVLSRWVRTIERKRQAILYGPPGTGKTYLAERLAQHLTSESDGFWEVVQFHPSYAYEDFMQGIRPQSKDGRLEYPLVPGRFLDFCERARSRDGRCVLVIDEINRADLSRVFGELMYLLEYRDREVPLSGGQRFSIPSNVRIIGTMNTADRSIALVDYALRRRFAFLRLSPNYHVLRRYHANNGFPVENLIRVLKMVNGEIGDPHYEIGITFFLQQDLREEIEDIWRMEIEPYLEEYFFDRLEKVEPLRWEAVKGVIFA